MGLSTKDAKKLNKASVLSTSKDPKDWDSARARQVDVDYKDLVRQLKAKRKKKIKESFEIDKSAHKSAQKKAKLRNLAKGNTNPNEKAAAEKKAGGPKLYGEEDNYGQAKKELKATKKARDERHNAIHSGTNTAKNTDVNEGKTFDQWKKAAAKALGRKKEERTAQKAMDAGARLRRKKQRQEYAAKISGSEDNVPDEMRD